VARFALPRELSPASREELAHDIMETLVERYPHSWAIHEPMAKDGSGIQPHVHIQFSTRREDVEHNLSADQWFKQPNHGGIAKDISWRTKSRLYDVRASVALLTNAALGREGLTLAVDHRTLEAQGISRDPTRYGSTHDKADLDRTLDYRRELRESGTLAYEALHVYAGWQDQAVKLLSLDREYIRDLTRDHLWRYDRSPARELERQHSMERTLELAMSERQPTRTLERTREPAQERTTGRDLADQLQDLAARFEQLDEAPVGSGLKVKLWEKEREREQGYGLGF
jgi:MobA/MobL family protein